MWYLDYGDKNYICGQQDLFSDLDETIQGQVIFGDTFKVLIKGKGNILIKLNNSDNSYIADMYYIQTIKHNMLSIRQPIEKEYNRYFFTFTGDLSKKTWIYFLKRKLEVLNSFKDFKAIM